MDTQTLYSYFIQCNSVSTDTRKITEGSLFFALKGDNFDANTFAEKALESGAKYVVIDNPEYKKSEKMLLVNNSLTAMQELARHHRNELGLPVLALTGSNGKTTTKELIHAVLSKKYKTQATKGNLNNHIGVPLTLLSFTKDTEIGIVEMGANHQKEIEFLCGIAQPNFGYITNFGKAHLEGFGGYEGVIAGKSELYTYLEKNIKMAFVNLDDPIQNEKTQNIPRFSFAVDNYNCDIRIETTEADPMAIVKYDGKTIRSNLHGIYNAPNICAAIAIGAYFKISSHTIKDAIESYFPDNNRSQLIEKNNNKIILDAYNANPSSMAAALANFIALKETDKVAILGDMFELGTESHEEHKKIVGLMEEHPEIETYFTGTHFYSCKNNMDVHTFSEDFEMLKNTITQQSFSNKIILIKGSRGMALERILEVI